MKSILSFAIITLPVLLFQLPLFAAMGVAKIEGTQGGSTIDGTAIFEEKPEGLKITALVRNTPPGKHGFHIHAFGSCSNNGKSAGGHYNPNETPHGHILKDGPQGSHLGDLGNIEVREDGTGRLVITVPGLTLSGDPYNVAGRSVILHEKPDDFGQPTGNAGARIGCGSILLQKQFGD